LECRNLYRSGLFTAAARELARCKLGLVGVQEVRWDKVGIVRAGNYNFFYGNGNKNNQFGTRTVIQHRILSAFRRVEFVRVRTSYVVLKGSW
jgi:hypothetical protein